MMHHFYPVLLTGNLLGNLARAVGTAVVNDYYFKVSVELFQDRKCLFYYAGDIVLFVITREKNTDRNIVYQLSHNQK